MANQPIVGSRVRGTDEFGPLSLTRVLGAGAFGIVFEAVAESGARFAVKFLQTGVLADPHERLALLNEVVAAAEVSHPNVVRVLRVSEETDDLAPYVVTEFADSGSLHERITASRKASAPFPLELIQAWSLEIAQAMKAINEKMLHRDLKPDNILLNGNTIKIADFGLAKLLGAPTRPITFKGGQHLLYMAPEAWEGQRNEIQVDMYSTGLVLYELATLSYPYSVPRDPGDLDAFRRMHLFEVPKSPKALRPELPQRFSEVITRLMSKRPGARYAAWAEVIAALEESFQSELGTAEPTGVVQRLLEAAGGKRRRHSINSRWTKCWVASAHC
jgi:NIMA (never in mitosis gene a)-related kinase/serine/threonine-protein kinase